jgi:cyclic peptide transporter
MRLVSGMIEGYKEITLHRNKKMEYRADIKETAVVYRDRLATSDVRFFDAFLVGESVITFLLGIVVFAIPRIFPTMPYNTIMSFVIVILYLTGPIGDILRAFPSVMRIRVAWRRIQQFTKKIPANLDLERPGQPLERKVNSIKAEGLKFKYKKDDEHSFEVGPIDLEIRHGEILFIIGGNGSGKTTLAMLLTGLYEPDKGRVLINDKVVTNFQLGEYFSTVFNPVHLFEKLYNIKASGKQEEMKKYLSLLHLDGKVEISGDRYSTINLSGGQRKRLALLQCYLEDSPIYLFDEWAADQDPEYRNFFYNTLLPEMKSAGKIVIAITHDDHYFHVADKVLKMKQGKLEVYTGRHLSPTEISTAATL